MRRLSGGDAAAARLTPASARARRAAASRRRVALDGKRPTPRVQPAAVASAIQLADFAAELIAGAIELCDASGHRLAARAAARDRAALVLVLMTRRLAPAPPVAGSDRRSACRS